MTQSNVSGIRVILDLSHFFDDEKKKCYHYVDFSRNKVVRDVYEYLKLSFDIGEEFFFEINGCYISEDEDIRVICNEDLIKVLVSENRKKRKLTQNGMTQKETADKKFSFEDMTKKDGKKIKNGGHTLIVNKEILETRKENVNEESLLVPRSKKKRKIRTIVNGESQFCDTDIVNIEDGRISAFNNDVHKSIGIDESICIGNESAHSEKGYPVNMLQGLCTIVEEEPGKHIGKSSGNIKVQTKNTDFLSNSKPSHVQTCKLICGKCIDGNTSPKALNPMSLENCESDNIKSEKGDTVCNNEFEFSNNCEDSNAKKRRRRKRKKTPKDTDYHIMNAVAVTGLQNGPKHIKFSDDEQSNSCEQDNCVLEDSKELNSSQLTAKVCPTSGGSIKSQNVCHMQSAVPVSNIPSANDNGEFTTSFVPNIHSTPVIFECKKVLSSAANKQTVKNKNDLNFLSYPLLKESPKVNDIIAFQKWKMDANYCPGISEYITAKVLQISKGDDFISLWVLSGHEELKEPQGKFSLEEGQEDDGKLEESVVQEVQLKRTDLLNIRLMFP